MSEETAADVLPVQPAPANRFYPPIGAFGDNGRWFYNSRLRMTDDEQLAHMMRGGYVCRHRYKPLRCPICRGCRK